MKFTKPINREVDINGETYVVKMDDSGVDFRLKGKRKSVQARWADLLGVAENSQGAGEPQPREPQFVSGSQTQRTQEATGTRPAATGQAQDDETGDDVVSNLSRTMSAGEGTPES